ncbi:response regulator [Actinophytocola sediminis]
MLRVAVVDDHPVAREGLRAILAATEIEVVAAHAHPDELGAVEYDVVVLDLYLDPDSGRPALDHVRRLAETRPVLVISASRHPEDVVAAVNAGASGFLNKQSTAESYVEAITVLAAGDFHVSAQLADMVAAVLPGLPADRPELSPREQETLSYIARGFTHGQTATRMGVSKATVDTYVARIRAKLQVGNKAELAIAALEHVRPSRRAVR